MNYASQLKGWSIDRALEIAKINKLTVATSDIIAIAEELATHAYVQEEDVSSTAKTLLQLISECPDDADTAGLVAMLIAALEDIQRKLTHAPKEKVNV